MNFVKKHWLLVALLAVFLYGVYSLNASISKVAAAALGLLTLVSPFNLLWWLVSFWANGFTFGWFPDSFYDFLPRQDATAKFSLGH